MQEQQNPLFVNRASFFVNMKERGLADLELEFGRIENGDLNFAGRDANGDTLSVCVRIKSADDFQELDLSSEETLESFIHFERLCVEMIKSGGESVTYYDSYVDKEALAERVKDMSSYVQRVSQEQIENVDLDHFLTCVHFDPSKEFHINLVVRPTETGVTAAFCCDDNSAYDMAINEQTRALDITRFILDVFRNAGYMGERDKATNILLAVLEYVVSGK